MIDIDDYEAVNLLWLLRVARRLGLDTGDWLGQLTFKLEARQCELREPNSSPRTTDMRLAAAARKIVDETGWLIEHHYTIPNTGVRYWEGIDPDMSSCWTENPSNAVRFARKVDAESLRETLEYMWGDVRVAEHMWVGPVKP